MATDQLHLELFAFPAESKPSERLEERLTRFLKSSSDTECLDDSTFAKTTGSETKADYLLGGRSFVAELKTLNGDPSERIENRMRKRLFQQGAPLVYGKVGIEQVLGALPDEEAVAKEIFDLSARAVRRNLKKADEQIAAIKSRLNLPNAAGLVILMNDREEMIDAATIAYALKSAFDTTPGGFSNIAHVWVSVECHRIRTPDGALGYPQLHIFRSRAPASEHTFIRTMLAAWGRTNGANTILIPHRGAWKSMEAIFDNGPPVIAPYELAKK